jgi:hypothetical protein
MQQPDHDACQWDQAEAPEIRIHAPELAGRDRGGESVRRQSAGRLVCKLEIRACRR